MRISFYAPLKPPDAPTPSGDRRVARLLIEALTLAGHQVEIAARLRAREPRGDLAAQMAIAAEGGQIAARLIADYRARPEAERPDAWITYHLYYKAPDWVGPRVAAALAIPYIAIEASVAMKRAGGPWSMGHEAVVAALARARAVIALNPADEEGLRGHVRVGAVHRLAPFLDDAPYARAAASRDAHRADVARRFSLDPARPWLLAVAMMRAGDKRKSFGVLAQALTRIDRPWQLVIVGDGGARAEIEAEFAPFGARARFIGLMAENDLPPVYAAADLYVWPAINEAFGMAILEAQASGLAVVAGDVGGVSAIVAHGRTGLLTRAGDAEDFAGAVGALLADPASRAAMSAAARTKFAREHAIAAASASLDRILRGLT